MRRLPLVTALLFVLAASSAQAASSFVVRGAGWGHGIGMSQYGALGYAQQGYTHEQILKAYYAQTTIGIVAPSPAVRVLLQSGRSSYKVSGIARAEGATTDPAKTYTATRRDGKLVLLDGATQVTSTASPPLRLDAPDGRALTLRGTSVPGVTNGRYRGGLELRPTGSRGLQAINVVGLESYLRGVVPAESPASWPAAALQAQAVAARSYAVTTNVGTRDDGIDQYADVRSQVYRGVVAEQATTDAAIAATAGQVVLYDGRPIQTFFFSTSGGHTEDIQNSFIGALPKPWLKGVKDPFDDVSPRHRWRVAMSAKSAAAKLRGLFKGSFRGVQVVSRGASPRVVRARVLGTGGNGVTTGPELRRRLGLFDTWAAFTLVTSKRKKERPAPEPKGTAAAPEVGAPGGVEAKASRVYRVVSPPR